MGEIITYLRVLIGCFLAMMVSIASVYFYSSGIIFADMARDLGWSRMSISSSSSVLTFGVALTAPVWGRIIDRWPAHLVVSAAMAAVAASYILISLVAASLPVFLILIALLAVSGTGSSPVTLTSIIIRHFSQRRGTALGIVLMAAGFGGIIGPILVNFAIAHGGWRLGFAALALSVIIALPVVWWCLRLSKPGAASSSRLKESGPAVSGMTRPEAMKERRFWLLFIATLLAALGVGGLIVHLVSIMADRGMALTRAGALASVVGLSVVISRFGTGMLIDRFAASVVGSIAYAISGLGCVVIMAFPEFGLIGALLLGVGMGAEVDIVSYLVPRYFGMLAHGSIFGIQYSAFLVGTGVSPFLMGMAYDNFGNYDIALSVTLACLLSASLIMLVLPRREFFPNVVK